MVELRKRKEAPTAPPPLTKRNSGTVKKMVGKAKAAFGSGGTSDNPPAAETSTSSVPPKEGTGPESTTMPGAETNGSSKASKLEVGSSVPADIGGEVETHEGQKTTLKDLIEKSGAGIVVFTYPKASTPGCTTQACLFRDSYLPITGASLAIYGLSTDSPKSNGTFVAKQGLQYPLLCNPSGSLIKALGFGKAGNKTTRGVVVIDKQNTVRVHTVGGPKVTLDAVLDYVKGAGMEMGASSAVAAPPADDPKATEAAAKLAEPAVIGGGDAMQTADPDVKMDEVPLEREASKEEVEAAQTASEVADVAKKLDG